MTTASTQLLYTADPNRPSLATTMGGAFIKPAERPDYEMTYRNRLRESVALIDTTLTFIKDRPESAELLFTGGEPTAQGRLRLTKLYKPFDVSVLGGAAVLVTADICTYIPSRAAVGGRHWLVLSPDQYQQLEQKFNPADLGKDTVRVTPLVITFNSYSGTINGTSFTDIFVADQVL